MLAGRPAGLEAWTSPSDSISRSVWVSTFSVRRGSRRRSSPGRSGPDSSSHSRLVFRRGPGPMGRALAGALLDAGVPTKVWNRTPGRDRDLTRRGAAGAPTPEAAVAASPLTLVCVVNYDATEDVVRRDPVAAALRGRTLVNLTADTPQRARDLAAWAIFWTAMAGYAHALAVARAEGISARELAPYAARSSR